MVRLKELLRKSDNREDIYRGRDIPVLEGRLEQLLESNPSISSYVRHLEVTYLATYYPEEGFTILRFFDRVEIFKIEFRADSKDLDQPTVQWSWSEAISENQMTEGSFRSFIQHNPIKSLHLHSMILPFTFFRDFWRLETLEIEAVSSESSITDEGVGRLIELKVLKVIGLGGTFLNWFGLWNKAFDLSNTEAITLKFPFGQERICDDADITQILSLTSSLTALEITCDSKQSFDA